MTDEKNAEKTRWQRAREIFLDALDVPEAERRAFLTAACGADAALMAEVERYLAADAAEAGVLDEPLEEIAMAIFDHDASGDASRDASGDAADETREIGPYRLSEVLGEGGMGVVWRAVQRTPVKREVAVKLIRPGMDAAEVLGRFESERQALAVMEHPSIAKVFDGGTTADGQPYFVMELIRGLPITEYCDLHRLDARRRVMLFETVCQAVHHAHQKGVIHRDLKPSNILVTHTDGKPVPKIIDFGVAKATSGYLTDRTLHTHLGQVIGTPEYMSPEQAEATGLDVDTRTDVYSLGVVLYELLIGTLPFDRPFYRRPDFLLGYFLRDTLAPTPSKRLESLADTQLTVARLRATPLPVLRRQLKGDLDWITMRALEQDRSQRYASANELAADLRRYIDSEPVVARPPSLRYRLGRLVRRNRAATAGFSLAVTALVAGLAGTGAGLVEARSSQQEALAEAAVSEEVSNFLIRLFEVSAPSERGGDSVSARTLLDRGATRVRETLSGQPELQARFGAVISEVYASLGAPLPALEMQEFATEVLEQELEGEHPELTGALVRLMGRYASLGPDTSMTRKVRETADRIDRLLDERGIDAPVVRATAELSRGAAMALDPEEADRLMRSALERLRPFASDTAGRVELGGGSPRSVYLRALNNNAIFAFRTGDMARATELFEAFVAESQLDYGPEDVRLTDALNNLAVLLSRQRQADSAAVLWRRVIELREASLGPDHLDLASPLTNLGRVTLAMGDTAAAVEMWVRADELWNAAFGERHRYGPKTALVWVFLAQGRIEDAERLARQRWEGLQDASLTEPWPSAGARRALAGVLSAQGRYAEAESHLRFVVDGLLPDWLEGLGDDGRPDPEHWYANELAMISQDLPRAMEELADVLRLTGRGEEADDLAARAGAIRAVAPGSS